MAIAVYGALCYACAKKAIYDKSVFGLTTPGANFTEYCLISGTSMTWSTAKTACSSVGYSLAVLNSEDKAAFIWANRNWFK